MTIREALRHARHLLAASPSPRLDAQLLLCHVLRVERSHLAAYDERQLSAGDAAAYTALLKRRQQGEPVAYILGTKGFYDLDFIVTPDVLIPRPATEHLVEAALAWAQDKSALTAADTGTGSGAIAITVAKHVPQATMHATDISPAALRIARQNAALHGVDVQFHEGHLAQPLIEAGIGVDLLMANLPYIRSGELPSLEVSRYEPYQALDGGDDGLDHVRDLLRQAPQVCNPGALILLEIGAEQGQAVLDFARKTLNLRGAAIHKDYGGHDRVAHLQLLPAA